MATVAAFHDQGRSGPCCSLEAGSPQPCHITRLASQETPRRPQALDDCHARRPRRPGDAKTTPKGRGGGLKASTSVGLHVYTLYPLKTEDKIQIEVASMGCRAEAWAGVVPYDGYWPSKEPDPTVHLAVFRVSNTVGLWARPGRRSASKTDRPCPQSIWVLASGLCSSLAWQSMDRSESAEHAMHACGGVG